VSDRADREILTLLSGAKESYYGYHSYYETMPSRFRLTGPVARTVIPLICKTGRCWIAPDPNGELVHNLAWDDGPPWEFWVDIKRDQKKRRYEVTGSLRRDGEHKPLGDPKMITQGGIVFWPDHAARLDEGNAFE
jgi:hypothetical protein